MNLIPFINRLTQALSWHPQRSLTFAYIISSLFDQGSVQHHALIRTFDSSDSLIKSQLERLRRFFAQQIIDYESFAKALVLQSFKRIPQMHLILDRTNWKQGKMDINYLVLVARVGKVTFPLFGR